MSPLQKQMRDAMVLRGLAARTQQAYVFAVVRLAQHYRRSPDCLSADEVRQFLLVLLNERHRARSTVNQYSCAYRFLYGTVLGRADADVQIPLGKLEQKLPEILSRAELARLFALTRREKARTFLQLAYATGLRVSEIQHLRVADIDSAPDRMCVRVVHGKGAKDRYVPLAPDALVLLRQWWRSSRPRHWLFTGQSDPLEPVKINTVQRWYRAGCVRAGITKRGGVHTLRHCYATHLLEAGVDLHSLSQWLGHSQVSTTTRYLHLAQPNCPDGARARPLDLLTCLPKGKVPGKPG